MSISASESRPIPEGTDLILRSPRGERVALAVNPDGSISLANVDTDARPEWLASVHLDGVSARVLRDWLEAVEVVAPSGEMLDIVPGWAVARQVSELHSLRKIVADLSDRLAAIEATS